ncbi:MAG: ATP-dependent zinc metalloprotease FtsH [Deltaproteobacteria bacterium]|nr:ATP-dependent zinc metalloprotease FtsH [Deltaproteobacteria bacterium]MBW2415525.1 ATP-dependent zinc metalloprotease FtsH [Deltaproteobacteria bacterium]
MRLTFPTGWSLWALLIGIWLVVLLGQSWYESRQITTIPYSQFVEYQKQGRVRELVISSERITGRLTDAVGGEPDAFTTVRVDPELADRLTTEGLEFEGTVEDTWASRILSWFLPLLLMLAFWMFMIRRLGQSGGLGGGLMSVGKSRAKIYADEEVSVTFDDVAGVDEAKEELKEVIGFLRAPAEYERLGARLPKGILLVGPPGTGKTLLARAVAGEAGVPFFSISGSEFVEMFVGVGAARVRDLFEQARERAPCIIFIDELDALARARGIGPMSGGHDEKEQTLNQLLSELDGFDPSDGVVLLAATNRPEILDAALLRSGRFDRQVLVDRPDKSGRVAILNVHLRHVTLGPDVEPEALAALTPGFTGADLANLVNEAAILATRHSAERVSMDDFNSAIERIVAGLEKKNRLLNAHEREVIAHHEIGHALVARAIPGCDPVHKVSIIPRGISALGYTIQRPTEDRFLMSSAELEDKMTVLLGGRAAETIFFGETSTGAADDLAKATDIARSMITRYGMDEKIGMVSLESERSPFLKVPGEYIGIHRDYSEQTAREVDLAVRDLVDRAFQRAVEILERNREAAAEGAGRLLEAETLSGDDLPEVESERAAR